MQSAKDSNLIYRAGLVAGKALAFTDGELDGLLSVDTLDPTIRQMIAATVLYRERMLKIVSEKPRKVLPHGQ